MDLKEKSTEKLEGELKGFKIITGTLIGVLGVLIIICLYGLLTKEDNSVFATLLIVPLSLSAVLPINYANIKKIREELESRK